MILPTKHINTSRSLIGTGAEVLKFIDKPQTVSTLWYNSKSIPEIKTFEMFTLTLDFLYLIRAIKFENNFIRRATR